MTTRNPLSRRRFLSLAAVVAASSTGLIATNAVAADLPLLSVTDPLAKTLGYVEDASKIDAKATPAHKAGTACAKCALYSGAAGAASGPCGIFTGKQVKAAGWCSSFVAKPV